MSEILSEQELLTITIPETSRIIGLGHNSIATLIANGDLRSVKILNRRLVVFDSIKELIAKRGQVPYEQTKREPPVIKSAKRGRPRKAVIIDQGAV